LRRVFLELPHRGVYSENNMMSIHIPMDEKPGGFISESKQ